MSSSTGAIAVLTVAIIALAGCAGLSARQADSGERSITYNCNEGTFNVSYGTEEETVSLQMGVQTVMLKRTAAEPPVTYAAHGLRFWPEGKDNIFVKRNWSALYHNCTAVR